MKEKKMKLKVVDDLSRECKELEKDLKKEEEEVAITEGNQVEEIKEDGAQEVKQGEGLEEEGKEKEGDNEEEKINNKIKFYDRAEDIISVKDSVLYEGLIWNVEEYIDKHSITISRTITKNIEGKEIQEKVENKKVKILEVSKSQEVIVTVHASDGSYEIPVLVNIDLSIKKAFSDDLMTAIKERVCGASYQLFFREKQVSFINRPENLSPEETSNQFNETVTHFEIFQDSKLALMQILVEEGLDLLVTRYTDLSCVQLYDRVLYNLEKKPSCSLTVSEDISVLGFGLFGPFPNPTSIQAFDLKISLFNDTSKESRQVQAKIEDQDETLYKFYLETPLNLSRGEVLHIKYQSGQGAVFSLEQEHPLSVGTDGVHIKVINHLSNSIASLYYLKLE